MADADAAMEQFQTLASDVIERLPSLAQLWFCPESENVVDLRLELTDDTWAAREQVIDTLIEVRAENLARGVSINYSFVLPDLAYEPSGAEVAPRVHAFAN